MKCSRAILRVFLGLFGFFVSFLLFSNDTFAADEAEIMRKWTFTQYYKCAREFANTEIETKANGLVTDDVFGSSAGEESINSFSGGGLLLPSYGFGNGASNNDKHNGGVSCREILTGTQINGSNNLSKGVAGYAGYFGEKTPRWSDPPIAKSFLEDLGYEFFSSGGERFTVRATYCENMGMAMDIADLFADKDDITWWNPIGIGNNVKCGSENERTREYYSQSVVATTNWNGSTDYKVEGENYYSGKSDVPFEMKVNNSNRTLEFGIKPSLFDGCDFDGNYWITLDLTDDPKELFQELEYELNQQTWRAICTERSVGAEIMARLITVGISGLEYNVEYRFTFSTEEMSIVQSADVGAYAFQRNYDVINDSIYKMTDGLSIRDLELNDNEKYTLYLYYLEHLHQGEPDEESIPNKLTCNSSVSADSSSSLYSVRLMGSEGKMIDCIVNLNGHTPEEYPVAIQTKTDGRYAQAYPFIIVGTLADVIDWFNSVADENNLTDVPGFVDSNTVVEEDVSAIQQNCQNGGGASSLGWILCPALTMMGNAATGIYEKAIAPILTINARLFSFGGENSGAHGGWETFRDIANGVFIIFLLFVIFSQLTGVGIDNYGIKKVMPKMIVTALLVNLSFMICTIAVDLSNIAGTGVQSMFKTMSSRFAVTTIELEDTDIGDGSPQTITVHKDGSMSTNAGANSGGNGVGATVLTGVGIAAIVIIMAGMIWQNPAILLSLLVAVLGVVVAILFLFVLLAAREALVVVLTVASPLAVICYMLPNTKKLFDKWLKLFEGLLLVFPICGLLMGGGDYASRLLISSGVLGQGFFLALTAMLVGIIPLFFIPSVLKGSFKAMGTVGGMLAGLGSKARGATTKGLRNTDAYKRIQQKGLEHKAKVKAGVGRNGELKKMNGFRRAIRGGKGSVAAARSQYLSNLEKQRREKNLMGGGFVAGIAGIESKVDEQEVSNSQAMLAYGKAKNSDGSVVNANDANSLGVFHKEALVRYKNAKNGNEKAKAMADIKAAQNILSKTDAGRSQVQNNLEDAVASGNTAGLAGASAHLLSNYGELYKSKNRGANVLITDLATAEVDEKSGEIASSAIDGKDGKAGIRAKLANYSYDTAGTSKYTQESLANADTQALRRMANGIAVGAIRGNNLSKIQDTARKAVSMYNEGKLNAQPEAMEYIKRIAGGTVVGRTGGDGGVGAGGIGGAGTNTAGAGTGSGAGGIGSNGTKTGGTGISRTNTGVSAGVNMGTSSPKPILGTAVAGQSIPQAILDEAKENNLLPGDPEFDQFLSERGINLSDDSTFDISHPKGVDNVSGNAPREVRVPVSMSSESVSSFGSSDNKRLVDYATPIVGNVSPGAESYSAKPESVENRNFVINTTSVNSSDLPTKKIGTVGLGGGSGKQLGHSETSYAILESQDFNAAKKSSGYNDAKAGTRNMNDRNMNKNQ